MHVYAYNEVLDMYQHPHSSHGHMQGYVGAEGWGCFITMCPHHPPFLLSLHLPLTSSCSSSSSSLQLFDVAAWGSHYKKKFSYSSKHAVRVIHYCSESLLFKAFIFLHMLLFTWLFEQLMDQRNQVYRVTGH